MTDSGGLSHEQVVTINVKDENDRPTDISLSGNSISENAAGATVGSLSTADQDSSDVHSYTVSDNRFEIVDDGSGNQQLKLKAGVALDHEAEGGAVSVTVTTSDGNGGSYSEDLTINVADLNEGPTDVSLSANTITENAAGAVVGNLSATDQDSGDNHTYTVSDNRFEVVDDGSGNKQLKLKDGVSLDHEAEGGSVSVTVTTTDGKGGSYSENLTINVADINEAPTDISLSANTVTENATGAVVGNLSTTDPDGGDKHTYTVSDNRFEVVDDGSGNKQLKLKDGVSLDHEAEGGSVSITVTTTDADGASYNENFSISVTDVNERPTAINTPASHAVAINNAGFEAQQLDDGRSTTRDIEGWDTSGRSVGVWDVSSWAFDDAPEGENAAYLVRGSTASQTLGEQFTPGQSYTLSAQVGDPEYGGDASGWAIRLYAGNQLIGSVDNADYDVPDGQFTKATLTLSADDLEAFSAHYGQPLKIELVNAGNGDEVNFDDIQLKAESEISVSEGDARGTPVTQVSVSDADAGDTHSYSLVDDAGGAFSIDAKTGIISVADASMLDHEGADQMNVRVRVTDSGGLSHEQVVTINVKDENDRPTDISLSGNSINENAAGATVGSLSTADQDSSDVHSYTVSDNRFEVVDDGSGNKQLKLKDGVSLDSEAENGAVSVTVTTTDGSGASYSEAFSISVADVNEAPTDISLSANTVTENATGAVVGNLSTTDPDGGDKHTYTVSDSRFEVVDDGSGNKQLKLKDGVSLDHEAENGAVSVTVTASDGNGGSYSEDMTVNISDVNEAITGIDFSGTQSVQESLQYRASYLSPGHSNPAGKTVAELQAVDGDSSDSHTYSIISATDQNGNPVTIDASFPFEIQGDAVVVKSSATLDHETVSRYNIVVQAEDSAGNTATETVSVNVTDYSTYYGGTFSDQYASGSSEEDELHGGSGNDTLRGNDGDDRIFGEGDNDTLTGGGGDDYVDGGAGSDVAIFSGNHADYTITHNGGNNYTITDSRPGSPDGTDTVANVETFRFADGDVPVGSLLNAAPVAGADITQTIAEDSSVVHGQLNATDADGDSLSYSITSGNSAPDGFTLNSNGSYSFDPGDAAYQSLGVGDSQVLTVPVTVSDGKGGTDTQQIRITVTGTNDAPVADSMAMQTVTEGGSVISGQFTATDADGDALTYSAKYTLPDGFTLNSDGSYSFDPDHPSYNQLNGSEAQFLNAYVTVTDGHGGSTDTKLSIIISGSNDAPVITTSLNTTVSEGDRVISGQMRASDADARDTLSWAVKGPVPAGFTLNPDGSYSFDPGNSAYDHLNNGETQSVTVNIVATDKAGASDVETLVITVQGNTDSGAQIVSSSGINYANYGSEITDTAGMTVQSGSSKNDHITGTDGADYIDGGDKNDHLSGGRGNDLLDGGDKNDHLYGEEGEDTLKGGSGNDHLFGGDGRDYLDGGSGNDKLEGGVGNDQILGGEGNDNIDGGSGDDLISGGKGNDVVTGGDGSDTYVFNPFDGNDSFSGGTGGGWTDVIQLSTDGSSDPGDPWTITVNGQEMDYDLAAQALELNPDTSGVVTMADGSELTFEGIEKIEW
ncbi:MAG: VCBS domain-containing protein [Amphritea sp.]|nr:VCBS domain-containing protein [Amphritea sp.]